MSTHILNRKVHYHFHNSRPLDSVLSQMNAVHTPPLKIHLNTVLLSTRISSKKFLSFTFSIKITYVFICSLPSTYDVSHSPSFGHTTNISFEWSKLMNLLITQFSPAPLYFLFLRPVWLPQQPVLPRIHAMAVLNARVRITHPY